MYAEITSAVASAKVALDIAKAAHGLANYNELVAAVSEVNTKLMAATTVALASLEKQLALNEQVGALKEELVKFNSWERESQDYVLQAVGVQKRHFAQVYKPAIQSAKARHWACVKCFQERKIHVLSAQGLHTYACPNCKAEISPIVQGGTPAPIESAYE
jgi:enamine deaminase RidA (YjgF/YER057c/UK114 family)